MRRVGLVIGTVALLAAACGAFAQTTFTWQGSCGTQGWYDTCAIGTCGNNNAYTLRQNNWGSVRCSSDGSPAFPGSGDTAIIPSGFTVRINGSVTVGRIVVQPGATLIWASGNLNVGELVNAGTLEWANGDIWTFSGTVVNRGTWRKTTGYTVRLDTATLRNEASGVLELQQGWIRRYFGTATLQNDGLITKVSSNNAELSGLVITGTGRVQVQEGALFWNSCTLSNATVQVEQGTLYWNGGVAGNAQIASGTVAVNGGVSLAQNATLTVASGGQLVWLSGNWTRESGAQLVNAGTLEWANGNAQTFGGTVVNRGTWRKTTGYEVRLDTATLRNEASGVLELQQGWIRRYFGTATLQNDGLITKVSSNNAELSGLVITGTGRVQVQEGVLSWNSCTLSNATVQVEQGTLYWNGGVAGNAQIASGTVAVNGGVSLAQNATLTVASGGQLVWLSGNWTRESGAQLVNEGTLEWANGDIWTFSGTVVNRGTWRKTTGYTVRLDTATLRNEASGVLELQQGSISRYFGTATLQNDGLITKVSSNNAELSGLVITGTGRVQVQEGALFWNSCTLSNATVQVEQGTLYWNGGVAGNAQIAAGSGAVAVNGGVLLEQNATLTVASGGQLVWLSGNWAMASGAQLVNAGTLEWANGNAQTFGGTVVNRGTWRKTTGYEVRLENATLRNEASGVLELQQGWIRRYFGTATLQNDGLITKVSSNNAELSGLVITGTGRVQVQEGVLSWNSCTLSNATVQVEQGTLYWNGGVAGNAQIASGTVAVNGGVSLAQNATLTVASGGQLVWLSGNWAMASGAQLVNAGTLEWANGNAQTFGGTVVNRGTWRKTTGYEVRLENATLRNEASGVLELQQGWIRRYFGTATLQNDGLIKKVSPDPNNPTSASISDFPVTNRGRIEVVSGILNLTTLTQTDGETRIHRNAVLNLSNPLTLQGGKLTGAGQLNGAVANSTGNATFAAGIDDPDQSDLNPLGILTLNGNLTQNDDTVVEVELAGTDNSDPANPQYDQLVVIGASGRTVQLNGTLRVKGRNGFLPQAGDTFDILVRSGSSWSRTGAFHTVEIDPDTLPCVGFEVQYLADRVRLVAQTLGGPDVNRDGCVDDADLLAVLFAFGQTGGGLAEDVTCDGVVDDADLLGVLFNFGNGCG
jgi:Tfp pilus assembly protein PilP